MKNLFISVGLFVALVCVSHIWAQDQADLPEAALVETLSSSETLTITADEEKGRVKIDLNIDDEMDNQQALDKVAKVVRKIAGDEVADEIVIELDGMTEAEKAEIAEAVREGLVFNGGDIPPWAGGVAITAVVLFLLGPLLILIAVFTYGARKRRQKMDIIQAYLDSGKDVPHQVLSAFDSSGSSFRSGLMYSGVGLGIIAAFNAANDSSTGALGLIPLFIGIAKLLYWMFEERKYQKN